MGYKHDRDSFIAAGVELAAADGLNQLTFGRLAKQLDINDRSIVYYFPTKRELLTAVVAKLGDDMRPLLADAFGDGLITPQEALRRAWPVLASTEADSTMAVFFELLGLAAAGSQPFDELAPLLLCGWIDWLAPRLDVPQDVDPRAAAVAAVAQLDGMLLLRATVGHDQVAAAATYLGFVD